MNRLRVGLAAVLGLAAAVVGPASTAAASDLHCSYGVAGEIQTQICLERFSPESVRGVVRLTNTSRATVLNNAIRVEVLGHGVAAHCPWSALPPRSIRSCATPLYPRAPAPQQTSAHIFYRWESGASGSIIALSPTG